ncbi:hypothetical protein VTO42DRAFT_3031 [Malbranchea cinnamomea]
MCSLVDRLAAKIALLSFVNDKPLEAKRTITETSNARPDEDRARQLSLPQEITLAQQFAFISAYSDDPCHVTAVAIEETLEGTLFVRVAVNEGSHQALVTGLREVARILEPSLGTVSYWSRQLESADSRSENADALLKKVISLNRKRILCRLRSRHASFSLKARDKPSLLDRLQVAQELLQHSTLAPSALQTLSTDIDELRSPFMQLEAMSKQQALSSTSDPCLFSLVTKINSLWRHAHMLQQIPPAPGRWTANDTQSLLNHIRKAGQYVDACSELLRAARRSNVFSKVSVELVGGLQLSSVTVKDPNPVMQNAVSRKLLHRVATHMGKPVEEVQNMTKRMLGERSRIHAEMQLVLFYERNTRLRRPRVICSSKSACFLCYLFLLLQGEYIIPSTHGKLYPAWKWPGSGAGNVPGLKKLLPRFVDAVEKKLQENLDKKAQKLPDPVESVVYSPVLTPSCLSIPSNRTSIRTITAAPPQAESGQSVYPSNGDTAADNHADPTKVDLSGKASPDEDTRKTVDIEFSSETPSIQFIRMERGQCVVHHFTEENHMLQVHAGSIHLHLECDISTFRGDQGTDEFHLQLAFLDTDNVGEDTSSLVKIESDWDNTPVMDGILFTTSGLLLQRRTTLLRLRAVEKPPPYYN